MKVKLRTNLIAVAIAMASSVGASAANLGRILVLTAPGEPLKAEAEVVGSKAELDSLHVRVASPDAFRRSNIEYAAYLSSLKFAIEKRAGGAVVKISSDKPLEEPFVDLLLELDWAKSAAVEQALVKPTRPDTVSGRESEGADVAAVGKAVRDWAAAWSRKDVRAYLDFYAKDFRSPNGQTRSAWQGEREVRITKPGPIEVGIGELRISVDGDTATAQFLQAYSSTNLRSTVTKTLVLVRRDDRWQILQERVGT